MAMAENPSPGIIDAEDNLSEMENAPASDDEVALPPESCSGSNDAVEDLHSASSDSSTDFNSDGDDVEKKQRHSLCRKTRSLMQIKTTPRRSSQPNMKTSLNSLLNDEASKQSGLEKQCQDNKSQAEAFNKEKELLREYQSQIEALQQEKEKLKGRLDASGNISADLSDLVDTQASEMQKIISTCEKQKSTIDSLRTEKDLLELDAQKKKASLEKTLKQVISLKRDRKSLRKQLKKVAEKASMQLSKNLPGSPPLLLQEASQELLDDFREQDEESAKLLEIVGQNMAMEEAMKILNLSPLSSLDEDDQENSVSSVLKEELEALRETCCSQRQKLEQLELEKAIMEKTLQSAAEDKVSLQALLEQQKQLTEETVTASMIQKDQFDLMMLRREDSKTELQQALKEQQGLVEKLKGEVKEISSKAQHYESLSKQQTSLVEASSPHDTASTPSVDEKLRDRLKAAELEIERLKLSGAEKVESLQECKGVLEAIKAELEQVQDSNVKLEEDLKASQQESAKLQELHKAMSLEIATNQETIESQKINLESLQTDKDAQRKELETAKESGASTQQVNQSQEGRIKELEEQCTEMEPLRKIIDALSKEVQASRDLLASQEKLVADKEQIIQDTCAKVTGLETSLGLREAELEELKQKFDLCSKELQEARLTITSSEDALRGREATNEENIAEIGRLDKALETAATALKEQEILIADQVAEIKALKGSNATFQDNLLKTEDKITKHASEVESLKSSVEELEKKLTEKEDVITDHQAMVDTVKGALETANTNHQEAMSQKEEKIAQYTTEIEALKSSLEAVKGEIEDVQAEKQDLTTAQYTAEIEALKSSLEAVKGELEEVKAEKQDLATEQSAKADAFEAAKLEFNKVLAEKEEVIEETSAQVESLKASLEDAKFKLQEALNKEETRSLDSQESLEVEELKATLEKSMLEQQQLSAEVEALESTLAASNAKLQDEMSEKEGLIKDKFRRMSVSQDSTAKAQKVLAEKSNRIAEQSVEIEALKRSLQEKNVELESLRQQHGMLHDELQDVKEALSSREPSVYEELNSSLQEELEAAKATIDNLEQLQRQNEGTIEGNASRIASLEEALETGEAELKSLKGQYFLLSKELAASRGSNLAAELKKCRRLVEAQKLQIQQQGESLKLQQEHTESLEESKRVLALLCENQKAEIESMRLAMEKLSKDVAATVGSNMAAELKLCRELIEVQKLQIKKHEVSLREQKIRTESLKKSKRELVSNIVMELDVCRQLVEAQKLQIEKHEDSLRQNQESKRQMKLKLDTLVGELRDVQSASPVTVQTYEAGVPNETEQGTIEILQKENERLLKGYLETKRKAHSLQERVAQLEAAREDDSAAKEKVKCRIQNLNEDIREAMSSQRQSPKEAEEDAATVASLKYQNERLVEELSEAHFSISSLQQTLEEKKAEKDQASVDLDHHITNLATLVERDTTAAEEIQRLRETLQAQAEEIKKHIANRGALNEKVESLKSERDSFRHAVITADHASKRESHSEDSCGVVVNLEDATNELGASPIPRFLVKSRSLLTGTLRIIHPSTGGDATNEPSHEGNDPASSPCSQASETRPALLNIVDITSLGVGTLNCSNTVGAKTEDVLQSTTNTTVTDDVYVDSPGAGSADSEDLSQGVTISPPEIRRLSMTNAPMLPRLSQPDTSLFFPTG